MKPLESARRLLESLFSQLSVTASQLLSSHLDDNKSKHVLTLATYGGDDAGAWVLLEALA